jgi:hypothetical protein
MWRAGERGEMKEIVNMNMCCSLQVSIVSYWHTISFINQRLKAPNPCLLFMTIRIISNQSKLNMLSRNRQQQILLKVLCNYCLTCLSVPPFC